jgi:hypothetical protein
MAAPVLKKDPIDVGTPIRLFRPYGGLPLTAIPQFVYDAAAGGSRSLVICRNPASNPTAITVSVDWTESLK